MSAWQAGKNGGLTLYNCVWDHLLLLSAEDLQRVRRFVLEHLAMRMPAFTLASGLCSDLIESVRSHACSSFELLFVTLSFVTASF